VRRHFTVAVVSPIVLTAIVALAGGTPAGQPPAQGAAAAPAGAAAPYVVLRREGRQGLPVRAFGGQEMFALDDLARMFELSAREDALAGGLAISTRNATIALTAGQPLASVGGRLVSLPAAPVRDGRAWFVPIDFVPRVLSPALGVRLDLRRPTRLIVVGDLRVPRVTSRVEASGAATRVILDVLPATPHTVAHEGNRLIVRFEADALDAMLTQPAATDVVQAIRAVETGAAIAIDLGPRFTAFRASDSPGDRGAGRITIDVPVQTTEAAPPAGAGAAPPAQPAEAPPLLDLAPAGGLRTIVIDAGHGGDDGGARGPQGTAEKDVTLAVARRLKASIEARLGSRVILTRDGDTAVGLDERAAVANNNKADLFISLHVNASVRPSAAGAEVFYLSLEDYGEQARRAFQGAGEALPVFGGGAREINVIQWELAQASHIEESGTLASFVEDSLRQRVAMSPRALQQAPLRVLVGANMPAVLVEMGFVSNPDQEKQLASDAFQSSIVQSLVDSIVRFRDTRGAGPAAPAALPAPGGGRD
jgi:N-acetylmuramoyl-L-alanine amidase